MEVLEKKSTEKAANNSICYHCGDDCPPAAVLLHDDHSFCCAGCQTVYVILSTNGLTNYYDLSERPGILPESNKSYDYLDNPEVAEQLLDFTDGRFCRITFRLPQIHCVSCVWLLEKLPQLMPGVKEARVQYTRRELAVAFHSDEISARQLTEQLANLGYAPEFTLDDSKDNKQPHHRSSTDIRLLLRLGVAGFCFGNLMTLSFPEYLGLDVSEENFSRFFGYLNILVSLPVMFYSGADYFQEAYRSLKHRTTGFDLPVALGMLSLFGRSVFEIISRTGAGYLDSLAALVFLLLVGKWFQQRTFSQLSFERDYKSYFPLTAAVKDENGEEKAVSLAELSAGQTVVIRNGQLIPADSELLTGEAHIDYSFVTGESEPINCTTGSKLYAGGRQWGGPLEIKLTKSVSQSYLMQLWNKDEKPEENTKDMSTLTQKWGRRFTLVVIAVAFAAAGFWLLTDSWAMAVNVFTAVLIVACPCALALNIPFAFGHARQILARKHFFLKNNDVIEKLAAPEAHCVFDKTGTLTVSTPEAIWKGKPLDEQSKQSLAALAGASLHPASRAVLAYLGKGRSEFLSHFEEVQGLGVQAGINGCFWQMGNAAFVLKHTAKTDQTPDRPALYVSKNSKLLGHFELTHPLRKGMASQILGLKEEGFHCSLLSGDSEREAVKFRPLFKDNMYFNRKPADKLDFIQDKQRGHKPVWMIGDGLNDAGALQQSDLGIAVSEDEQQFSPACQAILRAGMLPKLNRLIRYARQTVKVVHVGLALSLLYNVVGLTFAISGQLSPIVAAILMPLSSVTVVLTGVGLTWWLGRRI